MKELTDERIQQLWADHLKEWPELRKTLINPVVFARLIEAELKPVEAQEPFLREEAEHHIAGIIYQYLNGHLITNGISAATSERINMAAKAILLKLYTIPQPCPRCAELDAEMDAIAEQSKKQFAIERTLQAKLAEKDTELDRINRLASCGSVDSWMSLSDYDKRKWFAVTLHVDQQKAERIKALEADADERPSASDYVEVRDKLAADEKVIDMAKSGLNDQEEYTALQVFFKATKNAKALDAIDEYKKGTV